MAVGDPNHQVDNVGPDNFVLFSFANPVNISALNINPFGVYDRDVSYWVGTVAPGTDLTGKSYAQLLALGFTSGRIDKLSTPSEDPLDVAIGLSGNAILFGSYADGAGGPATVADEDRFKIASITAELVPPPPPIPEPTTALFGLALMGFCSATRRRNKATV